MTGEELFQVLRKAMQTKTDKTVSDGAIAQLLDMHQSRLSQLKTKELTAKQVGLMISGARKFGYQQAERDAIRPIVEFLPLGKARSKQGARWEMFSTGSATHPNTYLKGLRAELERAKGIYVFHDTRGRALYAGKAVKVTLWAEMTNAFNRAREVQKVRLVAHPAKSKRFSPDDGKRKILPTALQLHDMARYVSAYQVAPGFISRFEAILLRMICSQQNGNALNASLDEVKVSNHVGFDVGSGAASVIVG